MLVSALVSCLSHAPVPSHGSNVATLSLCALGGGNILLVCAEASTSGTGRVWVSHSNITLAAQQP